MAMATDGRAVSTGRGWTIGLWVAQLALAGMFGMSGVMHAFMPPDQLVQMGVAWAADAPVALIRFIGIAELAGTLGIILPALTRIMPQLTPLAALGFVAIQALALPFHLYRGEASVTPLNAVLILVALFVFWGRTRKAPIAPR